MTVRTEFGNKRTAVTLAAILLLGAGACRSQAQVAADRPTADRSINGLYVATRPLLPRANDDALDYGRSPASGAYIRLAWSQVEPRPGRYDWTLLDGELDAALAANKKLSISVITGGFAPAWLPREAATSNFTVGKGGENRQCTTITIGHPWDPRYQRRYLGVMTALAAHLRARPEAYRALRIVKMTAIAQNTEELRLPSTDGTRLWRGRVDPCRESNSIEVWREAGYAPGKVVAGWTVMADGLGRAFPDKVIAQDTLERNDFPELGGDIDVKARIVDIGLSRLPGRFAVQWNGLTADGRVSQAVLAAGRRGAIIGWQTNAFRGLRGAGCNADRAADAAPCTANGYADILANGARLGGRYVEIWPADVEAYPDAVARADRALAGIAPPAVAPRPR